MKIQVQYTAQRRKAGLPQALEAAKSYLGPERFDRVLEILKTCPLNKNGVKSAQFALQFSGVRCPWAKSALIKTAHGLRV